tara:strand:+ start:2259 stop:3809 length:1551 start_codon:yes stop_codon:yes gene_type:complete
MAATTLTEASQDEIVSIFKAISNKVQGSVEGLVKTTQPKLNKLVAETIDSFRDNPRQVNKQMNLLADRMKELGFSVDDLTAGIDEKDLTADMKSLQDAMRTREVKIVEAEKQVESLRKQGIAAMVEQTEDGARAMVMSTKELKIQQDKILEKEKELVKTQLELTKDTKDVVKMQAGPAREAAEKAIAERSANLEKEKEILEQKRIQVTGQGSDEIAGGGGGDLIDPRGMFAGISDTFMGIKDSITGPFVELGEMAARMGKSFMNFGKAMKTPIKSLKLFGASLMLSLVPVLLWAAAILALVALIAVIMFKFKDIKQAVIDAYNYLGEVFTKFGEYLKEKWDNLVNYFSEMKQGLIDKWDAFKEGISNMVDYVKGLGGRIWDSIKEAFGSIGDYIADIFKRIYNGFVDKFGKYIGMEKVALSTDKKGAPKEVEETDEVKKAEIESNSTMQKVAANNKENAQTLKEEGATQSGKGNNVGVSQDNRQIVTTNNQESIFAGSGNRNPDPSSKWEKLTALT